MNLGQVARMERRTDPRTGAVDLRAHVAVEPPDRALLEPDTRDAVFGAAVRRAGRGRRQHGGDRVARAARRVRRLESARIRRHRHAEHRRHDAHRRRRRSSSAARSTGASGPSTPRPAKLLWETTLEASAHATPMTYPGTRRPAVCRHCRRRRRHSQSEPGSKIVAFALPAAPRSSYP